MWIWIFCVNNKHWKHTYQTNISEGISTRLWRHLKQRPHHKQIIRIPRIRQLIINRILQQWIQILRRIQHHLPQTVIEKIHHRFILQSQLAQLRNHFQVPLTGRRTIITQIREQFLRRFHQFVIVQPGFDAWDGNHANFHQTTGGAQKTYKVFWDRLGLLATCDLFFDHLEDDLLNGFLGLGVTGEDF